MQFQSTVRLLKLFIVMAFILTAGNAGASSKIITIVHTNDLHSHLLGFSPNIDYTSNIKGDDKTLGGWARIASLIKETKAGRNNPVLVVDAGDFLMGSMFHLLSREESFELRLLKKMGYDVVSLGNHEFDLKPDGLARIIESAAENDGLPDLVLSNAVFSRESKEDDSLEAFFKQGYVKPYRVVEKSGLRIGFFGLMGKDAAEVAPFSWPVTFSDPIVSAKEMVGELREKEKVDLVVCLSHSGLDDDPEKSEDEILAAEVDGIDIIISGHTHTRREEPIRVKNTIIVQAWEYGKQVGIMDLAVENGQASLQSYKTVNIDDSIPGDHEISALIDSFKTQIGDRVLAGAGLNFYSRLARTNFDLTIREEESNLGNLIADSIRWYINKHNPADQDPADKLTMAVISNGVIRDDILVGQSGDIAVCDAFRTIPLGVGSDDTMGYPLISFYLYGSEIKKALEIMTSIYPLKGSDYFLQISGVRFSYNPNRMIFDRVTEIWIGDEENGYSTLDYSDSNNSLYRVGADIYNSTFLKIIGEFTYGLLHIVPKDKQGRPIEELKSARVDMDPQKPGVQELKEWMGVIQYIASFPDGNGDEVPDVPDKYQGKLGRVIVEPSWNPVNLVSRGTFITRLAAAVVGVGLFLCALVFWMVRRRARRK